MRRAPGTGETIHLQANAAGATVLEQNGDVTPPPNEFLILFLQH